MKRCADLLSLLSGRDCVYIQTHDFPDHDSVASAYALQQLLAAFGVAARIIGEGDIQRESLHRMIADLAIDIRRSDEYALSAIDSVIIVDGCKGSRNVHYLAARNVAVIDHHSVDDPEDVAFIDIRPGNGACATIIYEYYRQLEVPIPRAVATAMLIAIIMDTARLTRGVGPGDLDAFNELYGLADTVFVNTITQNHIEVDDLAFYRQAIDNVVIRSGLAFCYFPGGCSQNLMGILGDFFLGLNEVDYVVLCARNRHHINFSVRCSPEAANASALIQDVLDEAGFGGGHRHMAGGTIRDVELFDVDEIYRKFLLQLNLLSEADLTQAEVRYTRVPTFQAA